MPSPSAHAPSVTVPLRFMLTGLLALFTGMGALVARPELLASYHYNQFIIAVTHLFVLGWVCTIVMGAMYQLVPVALETRLYSERLARWQFAFHLAGFAGMVWSFWRWDLKSVGHFGSVLAVGMGLFVYNLARTLWRVPRWNVIVAAVASALGWLSLAVLAGLTIAAGKCSYESVAVLSATSWVGTLLHGLQAVGKFTAQFDQLSAMHAHAHLGGVGFFVMLIVGVSYKLVPMFTLSELQSRRRAGWSIALLNAGLVGAFVTILLRNRWKPLFALVLLTALALYGWELRAILRARKRRALDWGLKYFLTAIAVCGPLALLAAVLSLPRLPFTVFTGQMENLYGFLALVGFVSFAIIGMLYKIIPFLVWFGVYSPQVGRRKVPALADLYSAKWQKVGYWLYLTGLVTIGTAILLGKAPVVRIGCILLVASLGALAVNVAKMLSHLLQRKAEPLAWRPALATHL